jgi:AcrR family transcriptional regulator
VTSTVEIEGPTGKADRPTGPRAEGRKQAILDAALELLMEVGYDRLSMDALAEKAHAGKATIYRHWSGKAQVVAEAVHRMKSGGVPVVFPSTGSLRGDLLAALDQIACSASDVDAAIIAGVMSAMRSDPELAELVRTQVLDSKKGEFNGIIDRAVRRGELPQGGSAELVEEVISALLINQLVIRGLPVDGAFSIHVVDDIVLPLLHR